MNSRQPRGKLNKELQCKYRPQPKNPSAIGVLEAEVNDEEACLSASPTLSSASSAESSATPTESISVSATGLRATASTSYSLADVDSPFQPHLQAMVALGNTTRQSIPPETSDTPTSIISEATEVQAKGKESEEANESGSTVSVHFTLIDIAKIESKE